MSFLSANFVDTKAYKTTKLLQECISLSLSPPKKKRKRKFLGVVAFD